MAFVSLDFICLAPWASRLLLTTPGGRCFAITCGAGHSTSCWPDHPSCIFTPPFRDPQHVYGIPKSTVCTCWLNEPQSRAVLCVHGSGELLFWRHIPRGFPVLDWPGTPGRACTCWSQVHCLQAPVGWPSVRPWPRKRSSTITPAWSQPRTKVTGGQQPLWVRNSQLAPEGSSGSAAPFAEYSSSVIGALRPSLPATYYTTSCPRVDVGTCQKAVKEQQNRECLGGMRRPDQSVRAHSGYKVVGTRLRAVDDFPQTRAVVDDLRIGRPTLAQLRQRLLQLLGMPVSPPSAGLDPNVFEVWGLAVGGSGCRVHSCRLGSSVALPSESWKRSRPLVSSHRVTWTSSQGIQRLSSRVSHDC